MASGRFEMRVSDDWLRMVDLARGAESRGSFVKRLVEGALGGPVAGDALPSERAVPAARVTRLADHALERRVAREAGEIAARVTSADPDARRRAAGLPPLRRGSPSPSLERFAPDGRA